MTPVDCPYFYGDYFRGKNREECRLIDANPHNRRPWRRKLCDSCPVPALLRETDCRSLALEAEVKRKFFRDRVEVTLAVCTEHVSNWTTRATARVAPKILPLPRPNLLANNAPTCPPPIVTFLVTSCPWYNHIRTKGSLDGPG